MSPEAALTHRHRIRLYALWNVDLSKAREALGRAEEVGARKVTTSGRGVTAPGYSLPSVRKNATSALLAESCNFRKLSRCVRASPP